MEQQSGQARADIAFAPRDCFDARNNVCYRAFFEHITFDSKVHRFVECLWILVSGHKDEFDWQTLPLDFGGDLDTSESRHLDVEHSHGGSQFLNKLKRFCAVPGFFDDFQSRVPAQNFHQTLSKNRMVIRDQNFNF